MSPSFTDEQEARIRQIVGEALVGAARQRAERRMALDMTDIEFGLISCSDHPCEARDQAAHHRASSRA